MSIDLYGSIGSSASRSVLVLAEYLNLDINVKEMSIRDGDTKKPEFVKLNPCHTVPTIVDKDGFVLFESRAILTYLVDSYAPGSPLYPTDLKERANVNKILYYDATAFVPAMYGVLMPKFMKNEEPSQEAYDKLKDKLSLLVALLGDQKYFTGDQVTLADISLGTSLMAFMDDTIVPLDPSLKAWYKRVIEAVPQLDKANQTAMEIYKKFSAAK